MRHRFPIVLLLLTLLVACTSVDDQVDRAQPSTLAQALPTPTFVPVGSDAARRPPVLSSSSGNTILLDDGAWQGGYRSSGGGNTYGGRSAVWIYGTATEYNRMSAGFEVVGLPFGEARLRIEGMDSEDAAKTPIQITINGTAIFNDVNPLPNDDQPLESGTWDTYTWAFSADLLRTGDNLVEINNLARGAFSRPPFFMLDYAEVVYEFQ